ncbi:MAG: endonuclease/exonuclease/phosphatase family protein [Clostridiales Family XIII bacterium]|nr:endonuclease/exonuclease/phosphatase family protein [Clostridiales Family XIII bacterium]
MYLLKRLSFTSIYLTKYCKDKDLEACAIKLKLSLTNICILTIYRSPTGNYQFFLKGSETILKKVYKPNIHFIICGDFNINYLDESKGKKDLNNLLNSYNLDSIIQFPTRITKNSRLSIDNIFLDVSKFVQFKIFPVPNGLSDHDAHVLEIYKNERIYKRSIQKVKYIRKIDEFTIQEFQ